MSVTYFSGLDSSGDDELWQTDGSAAGTLELTPGQGFTAGFSDLGLFPKSIVVNGASVYFAGRDPTTNTYAIWSYSAAKGLSELTVPGATTDFSGTGFNADNLVVFNGLVYFSGVNAAGKDVLWKTDGTSAGTSQVGAGVPFTSPDTMTLLGGNLYFAANEQVGPSPEHYLWKLDGTTGAVTLASSTLAVSVTPLGSKLIFEGTVDGFNQMRGELYVYDPSTGQTTQLTQPTGSAPDQVYTFRDALAQFAVIGNLAYFRTPDSILSVTDGTVAGTHAITSFTGISGGFYQLGAVVGDVLMLRETNANHVAGLWVTNGTGAGTHEVIVNGAAAAGVQPLNITALNATQWIFTGTDAAGKTGLWVSDGTTAGTHEITGAVNAATTGLDPSGFTPFPASGSQGLNYVYAADGTTLKEIDFGGNGTTGAAFGIYAANIAIGLAALSHIGLTGADDVVNMGANSTLTASGGGYGLHLLGSGDAVALSGTGGAWDTVYGAGGAITLNGAQASVLGGGDTVTFGPGAGNYASLYNTSSWDVVQGKPGQTILNSAKASFLSGGQTVSFSGAGGVASLYNTASWDVVQGAAGWTLLNSAKASFLSGGQTISFNGSGGVASLYNTTAWDVVQDAAGLTILNSAKASFLSGGQTISFNGAGGVASLYNTSAWDVVEGAAGLTILNSANASFLTGGQTISFAGAGSYASLYNTSAWDVVEGASGTTILNAAQASFLTGGQTISFVAAGGWASLYNTTAADTVQGAGGTTILNAARATFLTGGQTISFHGGASAATLAAGADTLQLLGAFGQAAVTGFAASDTLQFSAADRGLLTTTSSGANTTISLDANDTLTLIGASVTAAQIKYV